MKLSFSILHTLLVALVSTAPVEIQERKSYGTTANDYDTGGCNDVILFFARGSTQDGNLAREQLATALSSAVGTTLSVQGIDYSASLEGNLDDGGCPAKEAAAMTTLITQAATKCPNAQLVVAGYSQGAAMVHRSIEGASTAVVAKIAAAVTFGDTQKEQDGGKIPNIAVSKTKIYCNQGDDVCLGTLQITSAHLNYLSSVAPAVTFITGKLSA
ncbi:cutinase [Xylariales sp. AK1849]|nr:cutinase [Xylariales sp. AK1849]